MRIRTCTAELVAPPFSILLTRFIVGWGCVGGGGRHGGGRETGTSLEEDVEINKRIRRRSAEFEGYSREGLTLQMHQISKLRSRLQSRWWALRTLLIVWEPGD